MTSFVKNKVTSLLHSFGLSYDRFDITWSGDVFGTSFSLGGLRSAHGFRGLSCETAVVSFGLRGATVRVKGLHLNLLLSHGDLYVVSAAEDGSGRTTKTPVTFVTTLFGRFVEWLISYYLKRLTIAFEDVSLRIESAQSGRSFAVTLGFDTLSVTGSSSLKSAEGSDVKCDLNGFHVLWEEDPSNFAFLGQKTPSKPQGAQRFVSDMDIAALMTVSQSFQELAFRVEIPLGMKLFVSQSNILDVMSLAHGSGLPSAWGLNRSPRALWSRAFSTIAARKAFAKAKLIRGTLARLRAERIAAVSFEQFLVMSNSIMIGSDRETSVSASSSVAVNQVRAKTRQLHFVLLVGSPFIINFDTKPDIASMAVHIGKAIDIDASEDGVVSLKLEELKVDLPGESHLSITGISASTSKSFQLESVEVRELQLCEIDSSMIFIDYVELVSIQDDRRVSVGNILLWDEWPKFWNAFLAMKVVTVFFQDAMAMASESSIDFAAPKPSAKTTRTNPARLDSAKLKIESCLLLPSGTDMRGMDKGYGFQYIEISVVSLAEVSLSVAHVGPYRGKITLANLPAVAISAILEDGVPKASVACSGASFAINLPLLLFWLKIKGPPPSLPPVTSPIVSILPVTTPDHLVKINLDKCSLRIGDVLCFEATSVMRSARGEAFYDSSTLEPIARTNSGGSDEFFEAKNAVFEGTHVVEFETSNVRILVKENELVFVTHFKFTLSEGVDVGGTFLEVTCDQCRPLVTVPSARPLRDLLDLQAKLTPYSVPQPIIPLEFRYFPDISICLVGVDVMLGTSPHVRFTWCGAELKLRARGGGNYFSLDRASIVIHPVTVDWNVERAPRGQHASSVRWAELVRLPRKQAGDQLLVINIDFDRFESQDISVNMYGGVCSFPFVPLKQILELREEMAGWMVVLSEKSGEESEGVKNGDLNDQDVRVVRFMDLHNESIESEVEVVQYTHEQIASSLSAQFVKQTNAKIKLMDGFTIVLLDDVEFSLLTFDINSRNNAIERTRSMDGSLDFQATAASLPVLHKALISITALERDVGSETNGTSRSGIDLNVQFLSALRMEFQRVTIGRINTLLKLLESKTTKKDDLKATTAVAVRDEAVPIATQRTLKTIQLEVSVPAITMAMFRICGRTKRPQRVALLSLDQIQITALKRRSQSRLEMSYTLSIKCMDDVQIVDPARLVIVLRANGQEEVLASVSQPKLDIDIRTADSLNFNATKEVLEGLLILKELIAKGKDDESFDEQQKEAIEMEQKQTGLSPSLAMAKVPTVDDEEAIFRSDEGGFFVRNNTRKPIACAVVDVASIDFQVKDFEDARFVTSGWITMTDASGLVWTRRFMRCTPLLATFHDAETGPAVASLVLLDPIDGGFLAVTMEGDSDSEWKSIEGASSIAALGSSMFFSTHSPGEGGVTMAEKEAKSVRSFQLAPRHNEGYAAIPFSRKFRFITKDVATKHAMLTFFAKTQRIFSQFKPSLKQLHTLAIRSEKVIVEGAGESMVREPASGSNFAVREVDRLRPLLQRVVCYGELEGTCLSFFSGPVPRRGLDPSEVEISQGFAPSSSMVAAESQRSDRFLGCVDLFYALAVYRENSHETFSFFIECAQSPTRVKLTFDSYEQTRLWESRITETIALCHTVKHAFDTAFERKQSVFDRDQLASDATLAPSGAEIHLSDKTRALVLGPFVDGTARFRPELVVTLTRSLVRPDNPSIFLASGNRELPQGATAAVLKDYQPVFDLQSRGTLINACSKPVSLILSRYSIVFIHDAASMIGQNLEALYYGVRNEEAVDRVFSWTLSEGQRVLNYRREQLIGGRQTRWYKLPPSCKLEDPSQLSLTPSAGEGESDFLSASLTGWLVRGDEEPLADLDEVASQAEICLPDGFYPSTAHILALAITLDDQSNNVEEIILNFEGFDVDNPILELNKAIQHRVFVASNSPRFCLSATRFGHHSRLHLVLDPLITIENKVPAALQIGPVVQPRAINVATSHLQANCGRTTEFTEFLYADDTGRSLSAKASVIIRDSMQFALELSENGMTRWDVARTYAFVPTNEEETSFAGKRRIEFGNGDSAEVFIQGGAHIQSESSIDRSNFAEAHNDTDEQAELDAFLWEEHRALRAASAWPCRVIVESRIRIVNIAHMDLMLRPKNSPSYVRSMLLRDGQTGFLADDDAVLEISTVNLEGDPVKWSGDSFVCRVGVSGVVQTAGVLANQCYKFAVEVTVIEEGCLVTIRPFYMLVNQLEIPVELVQVGTPGSVPLATGEVQPFHPLDIDGNGVVDDSELFVRVRQDFDGVPTLLSAPFRLDLVQELFLICDEEIVPSLNDDSSSNMTPLVNKNTWTKASAANSAVVSGDDLSQLGSDLVEEDSDEHVFAVCVTALGAGMQIVFVPPTKTKQAIKFRVVNSTTTEVVAVLESKSRIDQLPLVIHPGKTLPYVFRSQVQWLNVSILRYREGPIVDVDMNNVGWSQILPNGLLLKLVETQVGRCLVLLDEANRAI